MRNGISVNGTGNGKAQKTRKEEPWSDLLERASLARRNTIHEDEAREAAVIGLQPTEEQRDLAVADPANEWLLLMAVVLRDEMRRMAANAPRSVRAQYPQPSMIATAIAARASFLCDTIHFK